MVIALPRHLPVEVYAAGPTLYRAHRNDLGALYFGPAEDTPLYRFDAPAGEFKICYFGVTEESAFVEGVLHQPIPSGFITERMVAARSISKILLVEPLTVLRLHGPDMLRLGAEASVIHGKDYEVSNRWALAVFEHAQAVDGIVYTCRHDDSVLAIAAFDRARHKFKQSQANKLGANDPLTLKLLDRYGIGLIP